MRLLGGGQATREDIQHDLELLKAIFAVSMFCLVLMVGGAALGGLDFPFAEWIGAFLFLAGFMLFAVLMLARLYRDLIKPIWRWARRARQ